MSEYIVQGSTLTNLVNPVKKYEAEFIDNIDSVLPINPMFFETVDAGGNSNIPYEAKNLKTIWFTHHDSLVDNDGRRRLVLYKEQSQEGAGPPQGYDEYEPLFYEGSEIIEGVVYDRWRKIETGPSDVRYTWENSESCYFYTTPLTKSWSLEEFPDELKPVEKIAPNVSFDDQGGIFYATVTHDSGYIQADDVTVQHALDTEPNSGKTITPHPTNKQTAATAGNYVLQDIKVDPIPSSYVKPTNTVSSAATITPGTTSTTYSAGTYLKGGLTITGDSDLVSSNIKDGVFIFGVEGSFKYNDISTGSDTITHSGAAKTYQINTNYSRASFITIGSTGGTYDSLQLRYSSSDSSTHSVNLTASDLPARIAIVGNDKCVCKYGSTPQYDVLGDQFLKTKVSIIIKSPSTTETSVSYTFVE